MRFINRHFHAAVGVSLAFVPIAADLFYKAFVSLRPYWIHYFDPEVFYFYSSLNLLQLKAPVHVDHPGTPLQLLGAVVLSFTRQDPLELDTYRAAMYWISAAISLLCLSLLVHRAEIDAKISHICLLVWMIYLAPGALEYQSVWAPEMAFPAVSAVLILCLLSQFSSPENLKRASQSGLLFGFACALKFTFLFCLLSLLGVLAVRSEVGDARRRLTECAVVAGSAVGGFVIATSPILLEYPDMLGFVVSILAHEGPYATGELGIADARTIVDNLMGLLDAAKAWWFCVGVIYLCGFLYLRYSRFLPKNHRRVLAFSTWYSLFAVLTSMVFSATINQVGWRYALPAMTTVPLVLLALLRADFMRTVGNRLVTGFAALALGGLLVKAVHLDLRTHDQRIRENTQLRADVEHRLDGVAGPNAVSVFSYRFPHPVSALRGSAIASLRDPGRVLRRLDVAFPSIGAYNPWTNTMNLPGGVSDWDLFVLRSDHYQNLETAAGVVEIDRVRDYVLLQRVEHHGSRK